MDANQTEPKPCAGSPAATGSGRLLVIMGLMMLVFWMGHHVGYWYGRTRELYESAKRFGAISETTTWKEFLKRK